MMKNPVFKGTWGDGHADWEIHLSNELPDLPMTAVGGIYFQDEHVLLTHNHRGWDLTGGHIEEGESVEETLRREMLEEGGLHVSEFKLLGHYLIHNHKRSTNASTGELYPERGIIPYYLVNTDRPLNLCDLDGEECSHAELHHLESDIVQNYRVPGQINVMYEYCKINNLLFS